MDFFFEAHNFSNSNPDQKEKIIEHRECKLETIQERADGIIDILDSKSGKFLKKKKKAAKT